jgi:hypothetical protein
LKKKTKEQDKRKKLKNKTKEQDKKKKSFRTRQERQEDKKSKIQKKNRFVFQCRTGDVEGAIRTAFCKTEKEVVEKIQNTPECGCGATVVAVRGNVLYVGNVGDCAAVLSRKGLFLLFLFSFYVFVVFVYCFRFCFSCFRFLFLVSLFLFSLFSLYVFVFVFSCF